MTPAPEQLTSTMITGDLIGTLHEWLEYCHFPNPGFPADPAETIQYKVEVLSIPKHPDEPMTLRYISQDDLLPGEWIVRVTLAAQITPAAED